MFSFCYSKEFHKDLLNHVYIDGEVRLVRLVCLVRLQMDNRLFLHQETDKGQTSFFHDEQTVNGLRNITWASVFRLIFFMKHQHIYITIYTFIYIYTSIYIYIYIYKYKYRKRQLSFVC
jgi:hypothetical protein